MPISGKSKKIVKIKLITQKFFLICYTEQSNYNSQKRKYIYYIQDQTEIGTGH